MNGSHRHGRINRRTAVGRLIAGAASVAFSGLSRCGVAQDARTAGGALRIEKQDSGSEIWQVTSAEFRQSNIYCEVPYCSGDSRHFVYARTNPALSVNRTELMLVELGSWKQRLVDVASSITGCAVSPDGAFYYLKAASRGALDLMRCALGKGKAEKVYCFGDGPRPRSLGTVSSDGRYYASGCRLDDEWKEFGILLVDLKEKRQAVIDRDPHILNPHPQFEPGKGRQLMIQHNRGGKFSPDGKLQRLVGPEGATLYLLSVPDGTRTELEVGIPHTTPATGHEAWIGGTQEMLLSVGARGDYAPEKGNLLGVRAGRPARVVARGYRFNHVGVSRCGRFFCCDDWQGSYRLIIGSVETGRSAVICESRTSPTRSQNTHPHAYLTPDLKWVIFNSNRSGFPHVHAASVPEGLIEDLSAA